MFWCVFTYFQITRKMFWKKIFLTVWSGKKRVLMHLRILPDHQKLFFKKDIFERLEWFKTCFDAFAHTPRLPESLFQKSYFCTSGVVKKRVLMYLRILQDHQKLLFKKDNFECLEWLKTCFDAFAHTSRPPKTFFSKKIFLNIWSG